MKTKDIILKKLEENRDKYISGEELANELSLSRTAIWKAINQLKQEGYIINSSTKKGYILDETTDKISSFGILNNLDDDLTSIDIICYDSVDSTNTQAKRLLYSEILNNFTLVVSEEQTDGRGRKGRSFFSPKGSGIYMSIVLFPNDNFDIESLDLITIRAAVAVSNAIKIKTLKTPKIKWVNDVFLNDKKICGILSEADYDFEAREIKSIIIGIGINFSTDISTLPESVSNIADSLNPTNLTRNELISEITNQLFYCIYKTSNEKILEQYKADSLILGNRVVFDKDNINYEATAIDINDSGNLIVKLDDKSTLVLSSGEVSVKKV